MLMFYISPQIKLWKMEGEGSLKLNRNPNKWKLIVVGNNWEGTYWRHLGGDNVLYFDLIVCCLHGCVHVVKIACAVHLGFGHIGYIMYNLTVKKF